MKFFEIPIKGTCSVCGVNFDDGLLTAEEWALMKGSFNQDTEYTKEQAAKMYTRCKKCAAALIKTELGVK